MPSKTLEWLDALSGKKAFYRLFLWVSIFSLLLFSILFGYWAAASKDIDNSGMGIIIFILPVGMCFLLLLMSGMALFYYLKKEMRISSGIFVLMALLSIPVLLFGIGCCWVLWNWWG